MDKITQGFQIISLTGDILQKARDDEAFNDFEDAIQFHSAKEKEAETIITRNKKDFAPVEKEIKILTPEEFLDEFKEKEEQ